MPGPRVAFCGNIANAHFPIVVALRDAGFDAHLFVGSDDGFSWRPESNDPSLTDNYPDWIREGEWLTSRQAIAPWTSPLVEQLADFDLVVASGAYPIVVQFSMRPWVFLSTGGDLTLTPFPITFRDRRSGLADKLGFTAIGAWQRRAIRQANRIWTQPFKPFQTALRRLDVSMDRVDPQPIRLAIDTDEFRPTKIGAGSPPWMTELRTRSDLIVFQPSRLVLDESPKMLRSGQTKGSSTLLDGFASFVRSGRAEHPVLLLPDGHLSNDRMEARTRIAELGIEDHVHWATPPRAAAFSRQEMVDLYGLADVTVNEFGAGWFGYSALESMSCATPVISRIDKPVIRQMYGDDWYWLHAEDGAAFADRLAELLDDPAAMATRGRKSREWVERHHTPAAVGQRYADSIQQTLALVAGANDTPSQALVEHEATHSV